jgi:hypothetical protein
MNRIATKPLIVWGHVVLALAFVAVTASDAWAYIDPGTGSYLFQVAAAGLFAGVYTLRRYWSRLTSSLRSRLTGGSRALTHEEHL